MGMQRGSVTVGVFATAGQAKRAIRDLRDAAFSDGSIGLLTHDKDGDPDVVSFKQLEGNKGLTGAAIGVAAGAGGGALWALGIAAGLLPAIGPVVAGGLLAAVAASAAAGAGAAALVGTLVGLGISDEDAAYYDEEFKKGRTIVVVRDDERRNLVQTIFRGHGAEPKLMTERSFAEQLDDGEAISARSRGVNRERSSAR